MESQSLRRFFLVFNAGFAGFSLGFNPFTAPYGRSPLRG